jgi:hypothetical protein
MATNDPTLMQMYIVKSMANVADNYEGMRGVTGALAMGLENVNRGIGPVSNEVLQAKVPSYVGTPKIAVINGDGIAYASERVTIATATTAGTTAFMDITRSTIQARLKVNPSSNDRNAVTLDEETTRRIRLAVNGMKNQADILVIAALDAARTQVSAAAFPTPFDATADEFQAIVPAGITKLDEKKDVWLDAIDAINTNYQTDGISEGVVATVGSPLLANILKYGDRYGDANSKNLSNVVEGQIFYTSSNISQNTETPKDRATVYNIPPYAFGTYTWTGSDANRGWDTLNGRTYTVFLPELGFNVEVVEILAMSDQTGNSADSYKAAVTRELRFAFDLFNISTYNSDPTTIASAINRMKMIDNA